jgi:uncharacterized membrane protein YqgA involved in biofilm formation
VFGLGTLVNTATVLVGGLLGLRLGKRVPERMRESVVRVIGLATVALGLRDVLRTENLIFPLLGMVAGVIIGEALRIEERISGIGSRLQRRFASGADGSAFVRGFLTASLLYVVGPLTVLGAIEDGSGATPNLYLIKASLDGFMSVVFASIYGVGVLFSAASVFVVQGGLTLLGSQIDSLLVGRVETELYAAGGLAVMAIGLNLLEIAKIRVGSMLPGLAVTPLMVSFFADGLRPW